MTADESVRTQVHRVIREARTAAPVPSVDSPWMLLPEVQAYARIGRRELLAALADGSLRGHQVTRNGRWRLHRDDVDAWLRGSVAS